MTEMENQRRMNEWRMKENALNGIHTTLTGGIATPTASATSRQATIPGAPMLLAPRIAPSVASPIDDVDDADAEDDEDDEDDDEDTASTTGITV
ncbi:hypothetical protein L914_08285 [Phytophthora nicotianae]|uniref:Uncharacterized protein n=2 Tax=Phytophthora nicotianae TaxID=4792 RepID=V9F9W9_PHYNI|nr:hypothetical protein F443_08564 [Phytophthora nicotianae P1569]ETM46913.1 hypothetical protein L914_08285 [Phytophthora nicotianae]